MDNIALPTRRSRFVTRILLYPALLLVLPLAAVQGFAQSATGNAQQALPKAALEAGRTAAQPGNQSPKSIEGEKTGATAAEEPLSDLASTDSSATPPTPQFRIERKEVEGGAELLTIFGRLDGMRTGSQPAPEVPLVSVLRDTLGDSDPENDRLRYVWMLTYTKPTMLKRIASAIPFFYQAVGNRKDASSGPPKPILDLENSVRQTWNRFFWTGLQSVFLDSYGIPLKAASRSYRRNATDYRASHVTQALTILSNYESLRRRARDESELLARRQTESLFPGDAPADEGRAPLLPEKSPAFSVGEMLELRARLILSGNTFGGLFGPDKFRETVDKNSFKSVDIIGHNWEMLRQRAEAEGLYFEPLTMPDGTATHGLLWVAKSSLQAQPDRHFNSRFLSITDPWNDKRLRNWDGYSEVRYFDQEGRRTDAAAPGAQAIEMIPLALYGLNHPKIPAVVVDFRDGLNPKRRELSRRVLHDVTRNIFSLSSFGNLPYFLGKTFYDWVTGRRGMDLNQPTRLTSYSELKLLLSFNPSLEPKLRTEIERRLQNVSVNPLNNDNQAEVLLARQQYEALLAFAARPDGLPAKIERDRRAEMVPLEHRKLGRFFLNLGNILTFGRYVHREQPTPELEIRLDEARRLEANTQLLSAAAKSSQQTEVSWDIASVKRSLEFLAANGVGANGAAARATSAIFQRTDDPEVRRLCLDALYAIKNRTAKNELLRIYLQEQSQSEWRAEIAVRLRKAVTEDPRMKPSAARAMLNQVGQP